MSVGKNMIIINAPDFQSMEKSFKLVPITLDCPYVECLFSAKDKVLAVISKTMKQTYHMVPKLDDNGDQIPVKGKRQNNKPYKEERRLVDTFSEFYLMTPAEINGFVESFAVNAKEFDYKSYTQHKEEKEKIIQMKKPDIVTNAE